MRFMNQSNVSTNEIYESVKHFDELDYESVIRFDELDFIQTFR